MFSVIRQAALVATLLCCVLAVEHARADDTQALQELGHGYAMFHQAARQLSLIDKALWVKRESDAVERVVTELAVSMGKLARSLEQAADASPPINLSDTGLPRFEVAKRQSVYLERGLDLGTPILGRTGHDFERTLLLSLTAAINQQRHLARVMIDHEPSAVRKQWLRDANAVLNARYDAMVAVLERHYFCSSPE
ncbi:hypothetical protein GYB61_10985 [bacterium]|nr:hypothetical protein [bacterium]